MYKNQIQTKVLNHLHLPPSVPLAHVQCERVAALWADINSPEHCCFILSYIKIRRESVSFSVC